MNDKLQETINNMLGEASSVPSTGDMLHGQNPFEAINRVLKHLEQGIMHLSGTIQSVGSALDVIQLQVQMTWNILVEKGIVTKEELKAKYKTDVMDIVEQQQKQYQEQMQRAIAQAQEQSKEPTEQVKEQEPVQPEEQKAEEKPDPATASNVVLPSQKFEKKTF